MRFGHLFFITLFNMTILKKVIIFSLLLYGFSTSVVLASPLSDYYAMRHQTEALTESAGYSYSSNNQLSDTIAILIKTFLGLLGIIFIVLVVWAGYNWMTAGGNEDKVSKAKTTLTRAIIGLIITVSAYAITYFVFGAINSPT